MFIFVGLGNPGPKYALNRHNIGFMLMDALAKSFDTKLHEEKSAALAKVSYKAKSISEDILLLKPLTYMNLSGEALQPLMSFYKVPTSHIVVAHDEIDLPYGQIRMQKNRGHGGHNGVRNIHAKIGPDYTRLRMGVGRPSIPQVDVADYVLQDFSNQELERIPEVLEKSIDALLKFVELGFDKAQNEVNTSG